MSTADDAYDEWRETWKYPKPVPQIEAAFMAGYRRALEDAADELEAPTGSVCDWGHKTETGLLESGPRTETTMSDSCQCGHGQHVHVGYVGGCGLCEQCTGYRLPTLAADRDDLAAILAKHRLLFLDEWADKCSCGWADSEADDNPAYLASHRAHVAQMVLESDWLRGVRAKELRDAADAVQAAIENPTDTSVDAYHFDGLDEAATICRDRADRVDAEDGGR